MTSAAIAARTATQPIPSCARCAHANQHGWWGPPTGLTHCRKCHRDWPMGSPQLHCVTCCAHFSTSRACDVHLTATGCRPPGEGAGRAGRPQLVLGTDRHGAIWRLAGARPAHWEKEAA
jgi:hypothetical protein